jgi:hypothetical protein
MKTYNFYTNSILNYRQRLASINKRAVPVALQLLRRYQKHKRSSKICIYTIYKFLSTGHKQQSNIKNFDDTECTKYNHCCWLQWLMITVKETSSVIPFWTRNSSALRRIHYNLLHKRRSTASCRMIQNSFVRIFTAVTKLCATMSIRLDIIIFLRLTDIMCKRCSPEHSVNNDFAFRWKHAIVRYPPNTNSWTRQPEISHRRWGWQSHQICQNGWKVWLQETTQTG